jgi:hypothetical protein
VTRGLARGTGTAPVYSTTLGGEGFGIAVDRADDAYVTVSPEPVANLYMPCAVIPRGVEHWIPAKGTWQTMTCPTQ